MNPFIRSLAVTLILGWTTVACTACSSQTITHQDAGGDGASPSTPTNEWVWLGGPTGGLGYDIRMAPDKPDTMYVTDALAGIFKSINGGQSWFPVNEGVTVRNGDQIPVFCVTLDPNKSDTVWIGMMGERGLFRSKDGGKTWEKRDQGVVEGSGITFRGITVDPASSNTVYAAAEVPSLLWAGEVKESPGGDMTKGVVYKSTDGGGNWKAIWRGDNLSRYIWIDPRNSDVLYVSTGIFDRAAANADAAAGDPGGVGIVKSTDGGKSWQSINNGLGSLVVGSLFMHPTDPDILLAGTGGGGQPESKNGVYRTEDGGQSWTHVHPTELPCTSVEFSTSTPTVAYAATPNAFFRSDDGGVTWTQTSEGDNWGPPRRMAGFAIDLQVDPRDANRLFANNYGGGNFLSTDGGKTWAEASKGYTGAGVLALSVDSSDSDRVLAGVHSGIYLSTDGGATWPSLYPKGGWQMVAIDPGNGKNIFGASNDGVLRRSSDSGENWQTVIERPAEQLVWRGLTFAPSQAATAYVGSSFINMPEIGFDEVVGQGIYLSADGGASWNKANDTTSATANVWDTAVSYSDAKLVYVATTNKGVLKSVDGGASWQQVNQGLPESAFFLTIAVDPKEALHVFVGGSRIGLFETKDGGTSWHQVAAGVPAENTIRSIVFDPVQPQRVVLGDNFDGIYRSDDGGATWALWNDGLKRHNILSLGISADGARIYAGSDGGGAFRLDRD